MAWFRKERRKLVGQKRELNPELWVKCEGCGEILYRARVAENAHVCPQCGYHFRIPAEQYIHLLLDDGFEQEMDRGLASVDPLRFEDTRPYRERLQQARAKTGHAEAVRTGAGRIEGIPVAFGVMDFEFIGGSMGSVVGEKIARLAERATAEGRSLVIVSASGGARMMEGVLSLMQMAKTSAAIARHHLAGLPYVSVLTNPTTGGVTASFAMLGDVILAEPGALIGFAGPRVIEQTIKQELPKGFQRSEFLLEHGMLDLVVPRPQLKSTVARLLRHMTDGCAPAD